LIKETKIKVERAMIEKVEAQTGDKAMIILQDLICYLREKNILSRADIQELRDRVEARLSEPDTHLPCVTPIAAAAAQQMRDLDDYCSRKYGGKHRRGVN
jgi:hypothetical protein